MTSEIELLPTQIAISHRAVRLRTLQRMADEAEEQGNLVLAAKFVEMAAKEMACIRN